MEIPCRHSKLWRGVNVRILIWHRNPVTNPSFIRAWGSVNALSESPYQKPVLFACELITPTRAWSSIVGYIPYGIYKETFIKDLYYSVSTSSLNDSLGRYPFIYTRLSIGRLQAIKAIWYHRSWKRFHARTVCILMRYCWHYTCIWFS